LFLVLLSPDYLLFIKFESIVYYYTWFLEHFCGTRFTKTFQAPRFFKSDNKMKNILHTPDNYLQTLVLLKEKINRARYQSMVAVNKEMILTYLDIGKIISERVKNGWGNSVIDCLAADLQSEYVGVKGFSPRNLRRMRQIYEMTTQNEIWPQLVAEIPWRHTEVIFTKIKSPEQITFYLQITAERGWSRSILEEEIRFDAYEKHLSFQNNFSKTIDNNTLAIYRWKFKDEYNFSFLELDELHTERQLENALVQNITKTLGQFGSGFAFMGQQFRLELDDKEYFVDLLFYHRRLKCMLAIELKTSEFKPEHSQQLNWYLHLLDKTVKYDDDKPSIGILLCKSKSRLTVEYALELATKPIGVATYHYNQLPQNIALYLPSEEDFYRILSESETQQPDYE